MFKVTSKFSGKIHWPFQSPIMQLAGWAVHYNWQNIFLNIKSYNIQYKVLLLYIGAQYSSCWNYQRHSLAIYYHISTPSWTSMWCIPGPKIELAMVSPTNVHFLGSDSSWKKRCNLKAHPLAQLMKCDQQVNHIKFGFCWEMCWNNKKKIAHFNELVITGD